MKNVWPGDFKEDESVTGSGGVGHNLNGIVARRSFCLGTEPQQKVGEWRNKGIKNGLVPVIFDDIGCFWVHPNQLTHNR